MIGRPLFIDLWDFEGCMLRGQDFSQQDLVSANFTGVCAADSLFVESDLREANFSYADVHNCYFIDADLRGAIFTGCDVYGAVFTRCTWYGNELDDAQRGTYAILTDNYIEDR